MKAKRGVPISVGDDGDGDIIDEDRPQKTKKVKSFNSMKRKERLMDLSAPVLCLNDYLSDGSDESTQGRKSFSSLRSSTLSDAGVMAHFTGAVTLGEDGHSLVSFPYNPSHLAQWLKHHPNASDEDKFPLTFTYALSPIGRAMPNLHIAREIGFVREGVGEWRPDHGRSTEVSRSAVDALLISFELAGGTQRGVVSWTVFMK